MIKRTLYFGNPAYLSLKNEQLVICAPGYEKKEVSEEFRKTVPIEDIGIVVIDNQQITITSGLMEKLLENSCSVVTCDSSRMPIGLLLPLCGHSVQNERFREQLDASLPLRKQLWQQTVQYKIRNQAAVLAYVGVQNKNMLVWAEDVRSGDTDNMEARAAAYYWKHVFDSFPSFVRGREEDPPNNLLNYGYAVLRAVVARALVISGMLPTLGIHHHNRYNAYCLADDIMEPYRPYIDRLVVDMVAENGISLNLSKENKVKLLSIPTIEVQIKGERHPLMVAVSITTASLYKCFAGEIRKIIYPEM